MPQTATKTLEQITSPVQGELEELNSRLINQICPESRALCSILQEIFKAGGKRIRPVLSFLFAKLLDSQDKEQIFLIAEISELIHTASLVHDDIIDNSLIRRGAPTANSKWDNAVTVISGDFMFARAAVNLGRLGNNDVTALFAKVLADLCDGEIRQVEKKFSTEVDWDYYYSKTYKKTASLFEASCRAPALTLEASQDEIQACSDYGNKLGMAFQIIDDILDYSSDTKSLGKPAFADLKEGQITIPVLFALENTEYQEDLSRKIQELASDSANESLAEEIFGLIKDSGGLEKSKAKANKLIKEAIESLNIFPDSQYKTALIELAEFTSSRNK